MGRDRYGGHHDRHRAQHHHHHHCDNDKHHHASDTTEPTDASTVPFEVENPWFSGTTDIPTFSNGELLATTLRALLQRKKGRDLIDLSNALETFGELDPEKIVSLLGRYLSAADLTISRVQAEQRMFEKLDDPNFMADVRPLLAADVREAFDDEASKAAFISVFDQIIRLFPGNPWARTAEMIERFRLSELK